VYFFSSKAGAKVQPFFELTKLLASQERGLKKKLTFRYSYIFNKQFTTAKPKERFNIVFSSSYVWKSCSKLIKNEAKTRN
jgi:hypothetical protein